jgi:hypothetical protein
MYIYTNHPLQYALGSTTFNHDNVAFKICAKHDRQDGNTKRFSRSSCHLAVRHKSGNQWLQSGSRVAKYDLWLQ